MKYITLFLICMVMLVGCSKKEEAKEYVLSPVYVDAQEVIEYHKDRKDCEDIYLNENGSLSIFLTETQRRKWMDTSDIGTLLSVAKMQGVVISYSEDYTKMSIIAPAFIAKAAAPMAHSYVWQAELMQVLNGVEDWHVEVTVKDSETGKIWQEATLPEEELDWSFLEEIDS